jgi:hypothetical protein
LSQDAGQSRRSSPWFWRRYVNGVSTRKVDRLVEQLGIDGMTKDRVSGICRARRATLVHAIDEEARGFYLRHGLEPSPTDPMHLMTLIRDIAKALDAARHES